jgi:hypothetical protein
LEPAEETVRGALTRSIAGLGHAPDEEDLAKALGMKVDELRVRLRRLADAHALLLHPGGTRPWVVHPFALAPGGCWVRTPRRGYWANCLYCGLGVAAALDCEATITTRLGGEAETVTYEVRDGQVSPSDHFFHLSTPPARWWDNVIFACSSFQPFRRAVDVDAWCEHHALPRGAVLTIPQLWRFAADWYGACLDRPWRKRTAPEVEELFRRHGLVGPFWKVA